MAALVKEILIDIVYKSIRERDLFVTNDPLYQHQGMGDPMDFGNGVYRQITREIEVGSPRHISKIDLVSALESLYRNKQITGVHIYLLKKYIYGWSIAELKLKFPNARELLIQTLMLLEQESGYTDEQFLYSALKTRHHYRKIAKALIRILQDIGREL